jgi:hypothetical protein
MMTLLSRPVLRSTCPHCADAKAQKTIWKIAALAFAVGFTALAFVLLR